ncbi:hypothetical protein A0U93_14105 [Neoasaia chiangmaiensis]|uniref:Zinc ribbon domain-containing protein n=2 Tax=Neoasaia chiangmaiensis TaxID=320497 RepID=A0A1U9KUX1_9PROT|nr:hypothetical protein A0U93_14105 [Neoasaia chiangmaiensis]
MQQPAMETLTLCPVCRQKTRLTVELCPHCGAERQFGPTKREVLTGTGLGMLAAPSISTLLLPVSIWTGVFMVAGALGGFFVAHSRHGGDRWLKRA